VTAKLYISFSGETKRALEDLADIDGLETPKRIHGMLRKFIYEVDPPQLRAQGVTSLAAQVIALKQAGKLNLGTRTLFAEELETAAKSRFAIPEAPAKPPASTMEVVLSRRVEDMLPYVLAFIDLQSTEQIRRLRTWNDVPSFVMSLVRGQVSTETADNDAKSAEEEEQALYPVKKADKKADKKP
jgi:hypothetical protein